MIPEGLGGLVVKLFAAIGGIVVLIAVVVGIIGLATGFWPRWGG